MKVVNSIIILLVIFSFSCTKKKYPETIKVNDPIFYIKAKINSVDYAVNVGIDGFGMFPTYAQDTNGVYGFISEIKQVSCLGNCPLSLKIQINDSKVSAPNAPMDVNSALLLRNYNIAIPSQEVQFKSGFNKAVISSYLWDFGDGTTSNQADPLHSYTKKGTYNVCVTIKDFYGCYSTICNTHKIGYADKIAFSRINVTNITKDSVSYTNTISGGSTPFKYLWNFGDGKTSTLTAPSHVYKYSGAYRVALRVIDANNDTSYANYNTVTQPDNSSCAANYTITSIRNPVSDINKALSEIIVTWIDETGKVFKSNTSIQPYLNFFEVVSIEDYENNAQNQPTKKIKVRFNCNVFNNSSIVKIENAEAVICVAYK
jgi:PKD repeat protein